MSSKRALRRRSCTGKVRYTSFERARNAMHALLRSNLVRHGGTDGRLQSYHCRFCGGFHIGHGRPASAMPRPRLLALLEAL